MGFFAASGAFIETMYGNPGPGGGEDPTIQRRVTQMIDDAPVGAETMP